MKIYYDYIYSFYYYYYYINIVALYNIKDRIIIKFNVLFINNKYLYNTTPYHYYINYYNYIKLKIGNNNDLYFIC